MFPTLVLIPDFFLFFTLQKDPAKSGGEEKKADGGKKDDGLVTVVMKLEMHCEGCAKKIKQSVRNFSGI